MLEIYKEITQDELINLPVELISEEDVQTTRDTLTLFVELFKTEHS